MEKSSGVRSIFVLQLKQQFEVFVLCVYQMRLEN